MAEKKPTLWEVLNEYADVRDELQDILESFSILIDDINLAMGDISEDLDRIYKHLSECDSTFRRYKVPKEDLPF